MAFAVNPGRAAAEINVVPLIDVLLVLLIIFMVTAPLVSHEIPLDLPSSGGDDEPGRLRLRVGADGDVMVEGRTLPSAAWRAVLAVEGGRSPQPLIEIEGADEAAYLHLVEVLAAARSSGLQRIGFVTP